MEVVNNMSKKLMNKGQISPFLLWAGGIIATSFFAFAGWTTISISDVEQARVDDVQRIATLEADSTTIKDDVKEIKTDIKSILRLLK